MAAALSNCLAFSFVSSSRSRSSGRRKKIATGDSSQAYYRESVPVIDQLRSLPLIVTEDYSPLTHMENIGKVKNILMQIDDPMESMHTVNYLQKLGIDYHFTEEIKAMLTSVYENVSNNEGEVVFDDLFQVALSFRLLRQAGYPTSSDVLNKFLDKEGRFKSTLKRDVPGLLSLYEASHLSIGEEMLLFKAYEFSSKHLESCMQDLEPNVARMVNHTIKHPCHMTVSRYNVGYYLDDCKKGNGVNGVLEDIARMDFNLVQSLHQNELREMLRWWKGTGIAEDLKFARNQPLKWYLWPMTAVVDPQFSKCRIQLTKIIALIYIIDDIFDVYGLQNELCIFTEAIRRWDLSIVERLPTYMQSCYVSLYNITNDIAQTIHKEQGWNPIASLKKSWTRLCNAFLIESRWLRSKHIPKADEYLRNAVITSGLHTMFMHAYFLFGEGITNENVNFLETNPTIMSCPAMILRLWDDLGSAKDENQDGYDGSYVDCFMKEYPQYSNENARYHVKKIISDTWQDLNKECFSRDHFAPNLVTMSLNSARMIEVMYRYDDNQNLPILEDYINVLLSKTL